MAVRLRIIRRETPSLYPLHRYDSAEAALPHSIQDEELLILHRANLNFVIMNLYPYTSGHLMVAPYRHVGELGDADPAQLAEMMSLAQRCAGILQEAYRPEGFNIG